MSLQHHDNGEQGEFFLLDEQGKKIAKLTYFYETPDTINANHTATLFPLKREDIMLLFKLVNEFQEKIQGSESDRRDHAAQHEGCRGRSGPVQDADKGYRRAGQYSG